MHRTLTLHGLKDRVRGSLPTPSGLAVTIDTVWIVRRGERIPRFVTAFPPDDR